MEDSLTAALADRYELIRELGRGGMATVYLARDVRHHREVAIKVLHPELAAVLGAERFLAEIRTTANLQHPHILPLFDSGSADGQLFYVMPYVEGETLRTRLDRETQLPINDAVQLAREVADALQCAHEHGVIHRDIKPENILLQRGHALVADFGIALAVQHAGAQRMTQTGLSLGTPQYMSPEQAMGDKAVDARADIYALGAVTYEMLAGEPPFTGPSAQAIVAKVLTATPAPVSAARATVPESIEGAVMTALAKLPADRFASAADFSAALTGQTSVIMPSRMRTAASMDANVKVKSNGRFHWREVLAWAIAIAAIGTSLRFGTRKSSPPPLGTFEAVLPESIAVSLLAVGNKVAISRDGSLMAFSARTSGASRALFTRRADNSLAQMVRGAEGVQWPTISPDNKWLLYTARGERLVKIPVSGGTPITLVNRRESGQALRGSSWGDDNRIVYSAGNELWITSSDGENARRLAVPDTAHGTESIFQPEILPGSTHALVTLSPRNGGLDSLELAVMSLSDGSIRSLGVRGAQPQYAAPGIVIYERGGTAYAAPFSLKRHALTGPGVRILENVSTQHPNSDLAVSQNGLMVYIAQGATQATHLVTVAQLGVERSLPFESRAFNVPAISPDGKKLAVGISAGGFNSGNIWVYDLQNATVSRLTTDSVSYRAMWSRDGSRLLYLNGKGFETRIASRPWDGSGAATVLLARPNMAEIVPGVRGGLSAIRTLDGPRDIYLAPTDSLKALAPFVVGPADETNPRISPDGKLIAYQSNEIGPPEIYLRPMSGGARIPVSVGGGVQARWAPDGRTLYYRSPTHIMAARMSAQGSFDIVRRDTLFADRYVKEGDGQTWDVFPNGRDFLFMKGLPGVLPRIMVVVNWQQLMTGATSNGVVR